MKEEIEIKCELSEEEYRNIEQTIRSGEHTVSNLTDILTNIEKVERGYNFDRVRLNQWVEYNSITPEQKKWIKTENIWRRVESDLPMKVMQKLRITTRIDDVEFALDKITLNGRERYFIEAEAKVEGLDKEKLKNILWKEFNLAPREESKSYLSLLLEDQA